MPAKRKPRAKPVLPFLAKIPRDAYLGHVTVPYFEPDAKRRWWRLPVRRTPELPRGDG